MARNRIIKPEFWADAKIGRLSFGARLLYIAMWNFADDYGVISASPRRLLGEAFENDESVTLQNVIDWIAEIEAQGMIEKYTAEEKEWYNILKFSDHQKGFHKSTRRNPACAENKSACANEKDARDSHATCLPNVNDNGNVNGNGMQPQLDPTPEAVLFEQACAVFGEHLSLTNERKKVLFDIRTNPQFGAAKFMTACRNLAASDWPTKSITYFTDKKFDAQNRVDLWANGGPPRNGPTEPELKRNWVGGKPI